MNTKPQCPKCKRSDFIVTKSANYAATGENNNQIKVKTTEYNDKIKKLVNNNLTNFKTATK